MTFQPTGFTAPRHDLTALLHAWSRGDKAAVRRLTDIVYPQVLAIAARYLRQFGNSVALGPAELANELLLRLLERPPQWRDSRHFFGVVVVAMRNLLIDWSRSLAAEKHGAGLTYVPLAEAEDEPAQQEGPSSLVLVNALDLLRARDQRKSDVIEFTYLLGMKREEVAQELGISVPTVDRELRFARAWLKCKLGG